MTLPTRRHIRLLCALMLLAGVGCGKPAPQTAPQPPDTAQTVPPPPPLAPPTPTWNSDEQKLLAQTDAFGKALLNFNIEAAMALVSEDFAMTDGGNKTDLRKLFLNARSAGILDLAQADASHAIPSMEGDRATVAPLNLVDLSGRLITMELIFEREADQWMITDLTISAGSSTGA